jgi:ABC-type bacteriocin/lantibiotic exporter with double-glycine peptidase domain
MQENNKYNKPTITVPRWLFFFFVGLSVCFLCTTLAVKSTLKNANKKQQVLQEKYNALKNLQNSTEIELIKLEKEKNSYQAKSNMALEKVINTAYKNEKITIDINRLPDSTINQLWAKYYPNK